MSIILLSLGLSKHALQHHLLHVRIAHDGNVKQRVERRELPGLKSLPHSMHGSRSQRHKVRECILEEKDLVTLIVVVSNETRLRNTNGVANKLQ